MRLDRNRIAGYDLSGRLQNYGLYLVPPYIGQLGGEWTKWDTPLILPTASRSCHWDQFLKRGKHILRVQGAGRENKIKTSDTHFFCYEEDFVWVSFIS